VALCQCRSFSQVLQCRRRTLELSSRTFRILKIRPLRPLERSETPNSATRSHSQNSGDHKLPVRIYGISAIFEHSTSRIRCKRGNDVNVSIHNYNVIYNNNYLTSSAHHHHRHHAVCLTTGQQSLPKRVVRRLRLVLPSSIFSILSCP
jgi:hypothetical protein